MFTYSLDFQKEVAKEYPGLPSNAKIMIDDYGTTRETIRACQK